MREGVKVGLCLQKHCWNRRLHWDCMREAGLKILPGEGGKKQRGKEKKEEKKERNIFTGFEEQGAEIESVRRDRWWKRRVERNERIKEVSKWCRETVVRTNERTNEHCNEDRQQHRRWWW